MLHEADRSLLLLHPDNSSSVFNMDLERGQVIEEWVSTGFFELFIVHTDSHGTQKTDGQAIQQLVPEHKFAQVTPQKTLLAVNNTGFLAIDPRLPGSKVIKSRKYVHSLFKCFTVPNVTSSASNTTPAHKVDSVVQPRLKTGTWLWVAKRARFRSSALKHSKASLKLPSLPSPSPRHFCLASEVRR